MSSKNELSTGVASQPRRHYECFSMELSGTGSPEKIHFLKDVTRVEKSSFVFMCETISSYSKMEDLCSKLNYEGFIAVEPQGKSGGVAMFGKM